MKQLPFSTYLMDRIRRITEIDLVTNTPNWSAVGVGSPSLELNGESIEKKDAYGAMIAQIDTAKGAKISGEMDTPNIYLLASQRGAKVEVGSEGNKVRAETFDIVDVKDHRATLTYTPTQAPAYVYAINKDQTQGEGIAVGLEDTNAKIEGNVVTLPNDFEAVRIGVYYEYETADAVKLSDGSEDFGTAAKYIFQIYFKDICTEQKRLGVLVVPKGKLDNNVTLNLTTEGTHPFAITAEKEYCDDESNLYYFCWATK